MTFEVCNWILPLRPETRILVSVPHAGTFIPSIIQNQLLPKFKNHCPDTDWYVDELYSFCCDLHPMVAMIKTDFARYVVDLNRSKNQQKLYSDGRPENTFIPITSFNGDPLYPEGKEPNPMEIHRRTIEYYDPYHLCLQQSLGLIQKNHGQGLLIDGHSITRHVPNLIKDRLPDFMLGNFENKSCSEEILNFVKTKILSHPNSYTCVTNQFFKGGYITRSLGKINTPIQSLQIEMSQDLYLENQTSLSKSTHFKDIQNLFKEIIQDLLIHIQHYKIYP